jgi:hypothetical protein
MPADDVVALVRWLAPRLSQLFGVGFLAANLWVGWQLLAYRRRRRSALLVWEAAKPRYYGLNLALGALFGALLALDVFVLRRPIDQLFGELMMCAYYGYAFPMSTRIARAFMAKASGPTAASCRGADLGGVVEGRARRHPGAGVPGAQHRAASRDPGCVLRTGPPPAA